MKVKSNLVDAMYKFCQLFPNASKKAVYSLFPHLAKYLITSEKWYEGYKRAGC